MGIYNASGTIAREVKKVKVEAWEGVSERSSDQRARYFYFYLSPKVKVLQFKPKSAKHAKTCTLKFVYTIISKLTLYPKLNLYQLK